MEESNQKTSELTSFKSRKPGLIEADCPLLTEDKYKYIEEKNKEGEVCNIG